MPGTIKEPVYLYNFKHIDSVEWMLANGIVSINSPMKCPNYRGIGNKKIIEKRSVKKVPIAPYGVLNDYIPFYFASLSPMLFKLTKEGLVFPEEIVYFVTSIERLEAHNHKYIFTDGHALMAISNFYNDIKYLTEIDWDIMRAKMWNNTPEDNNRQSRREAELLVRDKVLPQSIIGLAVYNKKYIVYLQGIIKKYGLDIDVVLRPKWYY